MSNGTYVAFGFFALANGVRQQVAKTLSPTKKASSTSSSTTSSSSSTWFNFYSTTIRYSDDAPALPALIRVYSPPGDLPLDENTIVFMVAKVLVPDKGDVLLDAICMYPLPGDPASSDYEDATPEMVYPYVYGIGTPKGKAETLADGKSKGFSVQVIERVCDMQQTSSLLYVIVAVVLLSAHLFLQLRYRRSLPTLGERPSAFSEHSALLPRCLLGHPWRWQALSRA